VADLKKLNIGSIIDYAAESDLSNSVSKSTPHENVKELYRASSTFINSQMVQMAVKLSAFFPYALLKSITESISDKNEFWKLPEASIIHRFPEYEQYNSKLGAFLAHSAPLPIMIDAERLEIQPALDFIALKAMEKFNRDDARIMNTYQLYLDGSAERVFAHGAYCKSMGLQFPIKLVRGAYMNADKGLSCGRNYGPVFGSADETHQNYDTVVKTLLDGISHPTIGAGKDVFVLLATHNKKSLDAAVSHKNFNLACMSKKISCAQLLGMQDGLTESMSSLGMQAFKYLPYGPLDLTIPYLSRRAHENSSALRGENELQIIRNELLRRIKNIFSP
jgi:proline dehydrogenase